MGGYYHMPNQPSLPGVSSPQASVYIPAQRHVGGTSGTGYTFAPTVSGQSNQPLGKSQSPGIARVNSSISPHQTTRQNVPSSVYMGNYGETHHRPMHVTGTGYITQAGPGANVSQPRHLGPSVSFNVSGAQSIHSTPAIGSSYGSYPGTSHYTALHRMPLHPPGSGGQPVSNGAPNPGGASVSAAPGGSYGNTVPTSAGGLPAGRGASTGASSPPLPSLSWQNSRSQSK